MLPPCSLSVETRKPANWSYSQVAKFSKYMHGCAVLFPDVAQEVPYWVDDVSLRQSLQHAAAAETGAKLVPSATSSGAEDQSPPLALPQQPGRAPPTAALAVARLRGPGGELMKGGSTNGGPAAVGVRGVAGAEEGGGFEAGTEVEGVEAGDAEGFGAGEVGFGSSLEETALNHPLLGSTPQSGGAGGSWLRGGHHIVLDLMGDTRAVAHGNGHTANTAGNGIGGGSGGGGGGGMR